MASTDTNHNNKKSTANKKLDDAKLTLEGVKDKLVGGVKQTVGHLLHKPALESTGRQQRLKADGELKHHRPLQALTPAQVAEVHMRREALMAHLVRTGGFARMTATGRLRHVAHVRESQVAELFNSREPFALKRWNVRPLLEDIRQCRTARPLVHVATIEKGLLRSIKLTAHDFKLQRSAKWADLRIDIRRGGDNAMARLVKVKAEDRRDRSAPRLELLRSVAAAQAQRGEVLRQIGIEHKILHHVETDDKARPELVFAKAHASEVNPIGPKAGFHKAQLLDAVRQSAGGGAGGVELKHVETEDKAKPAVGDEVSVRRWNKEGFLSEVRQGTPLRHI
ncbi:uncharacterized protein ACA1_127590 [Acanthamoeba castellanii str. Neff]|uniref:Uncharacterized protein n=1 Tax=Acanthamoeba castellanii (strain ATCC 30010 / Neff) TaxID=1257118 RepID=L8GEV5_ACACF|nr:uncharacterized protein ACA1_127590 [Acanthamoeba castellanii str. Neff]ELR11268.1 hypothetical protein ACA1_127590 [Acanthamoeba castellanii str. Neff]